MATATNYVADNSAFGGPNAAQAAAGNAQLGVTAPMAVNTLTQPVAPVTVPVAPAPTNPFTDAASIPNPPATPESILTAANSPTAAQGAQTGILGKIADLMKSKTSQSTLEIQQETAAGVPALQKTLKGITTQILGLNDQATALQNEAQYTIPNAAQESVTGRGVTAGGLAPLTASQLRQNQIKQGAIASQALTAKAAYYAANDDYTMAKDAADKAAQLQFDGQQQQIDYQKSLLDAIAPTLSREDANRATLVKAKLDDRATQIANAREDFKAGQSLAIAAMKLNPNDAQAQYAAQQALKLDPNDPQYLTKVANLVAQYQQDPLATQQAVDQHLQAQATLKLTAANTAKINADIKASQTPITATGTNAPYINAFNNATAGMGAQAAAQARQVFTNYINQGDLAGAKSYIVRTALANAGVDQQNQAIGRSQAISALDDISSLLAQAQAKGAGTNIISGNITNVAQKLGTTNNPDLTYIGGRIAAILQTYRRAMTGVAFSPAESLQYEKIFPSTTKDGSLNTATIAALKDSLNSNNKAALSFYIGDTNYDALFPTSNTATLPGSSSSTDFAAAAKAAGYTQAEIDAYLKTQPTSTSTPSPIFSTPKKSFNF